MVDIRPIDGYLVNPSRVDTVVSPAYDALTPEERSQFAQSHPGNYLNAMRSREEFPAAQCPDLSELLAGNKERLEAMIARQDFVPLDQPSVFIYRLQVAGHTQTGLVAEVPLEEYESGRIKKHEKTQDSKEGDLLAYQCTVRASSSPICLAYESTHAIERWVTEVTNLPPKLDFTASDGTQQQVWLVNEETQIDTVRALFSNIEVSYLTDGHHRAASTVRFRDEQRKNNPHHTGEEPYNRFLVSFFPAAQLRILEYNRCVQGTNGLSNESFLGRVAECFEVESLGGVSAQGAKPRERGEFAMYLGAEWYRLKIKPQFVPTQDPVASLDVSILQSCLFEPVLDIHDARTDPRLSYLSGAFSIDQLEEHCKRQALVGFGLYPTSIHDLMRVADAEGVMPPKSTWFDPKLRSGIFLLLK